MGSPKVLVLRPGPKPLERLIEVLTRLGSCALKMPAVGQPHNRLHSLLANFRDNESARFVLVIDQFEELFTECADAEARTAFVKNLAFAVGNDDGLVSVILTLRNDFADAVKSPMEFASAIRERRLNLQAMDREELKEAIELPARAVDHPWPPMLIENMVSQAEGRAGALPLLQFALKRLWPDHVANALQETSWSSRLIEDFLVEVAGAIYESAGETDTTRAEGRRIIRRAFVAMVQLGEGTADSRRVANLKELSSNVDEESRVRKILAPFTSPEARLITASEQNGQPTYELTHEALITSWDLLRSWLGNVPDRDNAARIRGDLRLQRRLSIAATEWKQGNGGLWRPPELELLQIYLGRDENDLTTTAKEFADASREAWDKEVFRKRLLVVSLGIVSLILVLLSIGMGLLWRKTLVERVEADLQAEKAAKTLSQSDFLQSVALVNDRKYPEALAHLARAIRTDPQNHAALDRLYTLLFSQHSWILPTTRFGSDGQVIVSSLSPDGTRVITGSIDGTVQIWNSFTGQPIATPGHHDQIVVSAKFSPDGTRIVTSSWDKTARIWDAETGRPLGQPMRHANEVNSANFSWDGKLVVTASNDNTAQIWDGYTGNPIGRILKHDDFVYSASFSPDNTKVLTASEDKTARMWDLASGQPFGEPMKHESGIVSAVFSNDGLRVVTASKDKTARLWDANTGQPLGEPLAHDESVDAASISPDGTRIVTLSNVDGKVKIWDILPPSKSAAPAWLPSLAEAAGGQALTPSGTLAPVTQEEISTLRTQLSAAPRREFWNSLGRWFFSEDGSSAISPQSVVLSPDNRTDIGVPKSGTPDSYGH